MEALLTTNAARISEESLKESLKESLNESQKESLKESPENVEKKRSPKNPKRIAKES